MTARPSTRNEESRVHERPADPQEASATPLESKASPDPTRRETGADPHHELTHPADSPDPTSDADPYDRQQQEQDPDADPEMRQAASEGLRPADDE